MEASGGVLEALYAGLMDDTPAWRMVERRFHRAGTSGHLGNCFVALGDGGVLGALHVHAMDDLADDPPDPIIPEERYGIAEPFHELDRAAAGSFHLHFLAVLEQNRGRGIGTVLIERARHLARQRRFPSLSLTVFEENARAVALYERLGFSEVARRPAPCHEAIRFEGDLLMMKAPV